jgi:hypothetical protein
MTTNSSGVPPTQGGEEQDLAVFVQNLLEQMVGHHLQHSTFSNPNLSKCLILLFKEVSDLSNSTYLQS